LLKYGWSGGTLWRPKCFDEALAAYDKALEGKPELVEVWFARGNVFKDLKRHDEAFTLRQGTRAQT
jgi:tetratricopeptide (TPR) repeat protein